MSKDLNALTRGKAKREQNQTKKPDTRRQATESRRTSVRLMPEDDNELDRIAQHIKEVYRQETGNVLRKIADIRLMRIALRVAFKGKVTPKQLVDIVHEVKALDARVNK